jgi:hypothetical protein
MNALVPLLILSGHGSAQGMFILLRSNESIPGLVGRKIPLSEKLADKSLRNRRDS